MRTKIASKRPTPALPFVGRGKEMSRLKQLYAQRRHVLILGPAGVGKSALVIHLCGQLPLLWCPHSEHLGEICESLQTELGLDLKDLRLVQRKQRLRQALAETGQTVVFDDLGWTTPKLSSFLESVMARVPLWLCARSGHSWDIGHFWTLLVRFERVELRPLHLPDTRALVERAVSAGRIPGATLEAVERLHHLAAGVPRVLCELLDGLSTGRYDPHRTFDLKLLDLDRRIQHLPLSSNLHPG